MNSNENHILHVCIIIKIIHTSNNHMYCYCKLLTETAIAVDTFSDYVLIQSETFTIMKCCTLFRIVISLLLCNCYLSFRGIGIKQKR